MRGDVQRIISDPGTQLVGASRELAEWRKGWNTDELVRFGSTKNLQWDFVMADSQHQNGVMPCITDTQRIRIIMLSEK